MFKNNLPLIGLLIFAFLLRLALSFLPAFEFDQNAFRFWSVRLAEGGFSNFYSKDVFTSNPVGFLFFLWFFGALKLTILSGSQFFSQNANYDLLLKLPANVADLATAAIIYFLIKIKINKKWALLGFALFAFNPVTLFVSAVWGQYDAIAALFALLALLTLQYSKIEELAALFFATALSLKPQTISLAPALGFALLVLKKPLEWLSFAVIFVFWALLIYLPFFPKNPLAGLIYVNTSSTGLFTCTTCFALNFWGIFGNWKDDLQIFLGLPLLYWGMILLGLSFLIIFLVGPFKKKFSDPFIFLTTSVSMMAFFIFSTRMHERYLYYFFPFLLISSLLLKSRTLIWFYITISFFYFINLYIPYAYYNKQLILNPKFSDWLLTHFTLLSFIFLVTFFGLLFNFLKQILHEKKS